MAEKITMREIQPFCSAPGCNNDGVSKQFGDWLCSFHANPPGPQHAHDSFDDFMDGARELIDAKAKAKGYNEGGDDRNPLFEFTRDNFPGHASGEVIYKLVRFSRKRNKEDLLKAAAWLYLMWRYEK